MGYIVFIHHKIVKMIYIKDDQICQLTLDFLKIHAGVLNPRKEKKTKTKENQG